MSKIAVLIPCYNESQTIEKVVRDFKQALPEATVFVYDNNSIDGTDEIARRAGAIVRYETRQGKGNVIRTMFREINADCYLMIDGDDTYPAEHAREMLDVLHGKQTPFPQRRQRHGEEIHKYVLASEKSYSRCHDGLSRLQSSVREKFSRFVERL